MVIFFSRFLKLLLILVIIITPACSRFPKEIVELSYHVGDDIKAIHLSYRALIQRHFTMLREQAMRLLKNRWTPTFLEDFTKRGKLEEVKKGTSKKKSDEYVKEWTEISVEMIEKKRRELIDPIDADEKELLEMVDKAFALLIRANEKISSYLNSLRKVKKSQEEALEDLDLKKLREKIDNMLVTASRRAAGDINQVSNSNNTTEKTKEDE